MFNSKTKVPLNQAGPTGSFLTNSNMGGKLFTPVKNAGDKEPETPVVNSGSNGAGDNKNQQTTPESGVSQGAPVKLGVDKDGVPYPDNANVKALLFVVKQAKTLKQIRHMRAQLQLPNIERTQFLELSENDGTALDEILAIMEASAKEMFMGQLDKNDPNSLMEFLGFKQAELKHTIDVSSLEKMPLRFRPEFEQMLCSDVTTVDTVEKVNSLVKNIDGREIFEKIDLRAEAEANFPTWWIGIIHDKAAAPIFERDMKKCLEKPTPQTPVEEFPKMFELLTRGEGILNRDVLSKRVREGGLVKFKPVVDAHIEFLVAHSRKLEVAQALVIALKIKQDLFPENEEQNKNTVSAIRNEDKTKSATDIPNTTGKEGAEIVTMTEPGEAAKDEKIMTA